MADKITDDIYWIGVDNPDSRDFHGIYTPRGGSYNSYLIRADKPTIIDGTNKPFIDQYLESLSSVIGPEEVQYIVVNHVEPDHTGALSTIMEKCPNAIVLCTAKAKEFLEAEWGIVERVEAVIDGQEYDLGNKKLKFVMDPMVHWPETMMTYLVDDKALFPADLFGAEISHEHIFADEYENFDEITRDYFAIVLRPVAGTVKAAIGKMKDLELSFLCPSHGPVYRKDFDKVIGKFQKLAEKPEEDKVTIVYSTIWHSSEKLANAIAEGVKEEGCEYELFDISKSNLVKMMASAMTSKAIAIGSLTMLGMYHPMLEAYFPFLKLNCQRGKTAAVFGTHGWVPTSVPKLKKKLEEELGYNVVGELDFRFGPKTDGDFARAKELGRKLVSEMRHSSGEQCAIPNKQ